MSKAAKAAMKRPDEPTGVVELNSGDERAVINVRLHRDRRGIFRLSLSMRSRASGPLKNVKNAAWQLGQICDRATRHAKASGGEVAAWGFPMFAQSRTLMRFLRAALCDEMRSAQLVAGEAGLRLSVVLKCQPGSASWANAEMILPPN